MEPLQRPLGSRAEGEPARLAVGPYETRVSDSRFVLRQHDDHCPYDHQAAGATMTENAIHTIADIRRALQRRTRSLDTGCPLVAAAGRETLGAKDTRLREVTPLITASDAGERSRL